jgi:hypothetical protein
MVRRVLGIALILGVALIFGFPLRIIPNWLRLAAFCWSILIAGYFTFKDDKPKDNG